MVQRGMTVTSALEQYTVLTVGDGLVSQIPVRAVEAGRAGAGEGSDDLA